MQSSFNWHGLSGALLWLSVTAALLSACWPAVVALADYLYFAWVARKTQGFHFRRSLYSRRFMVLRAGETFLYQGRIQRWNEPQHLSETVAWLQTQKDLA